MTEVPHHPTCPMENVRVREEMTGVNSRLPLLPKNVSFVPWVGKTYDGSKQFRSIRILILAESHYEWCNRCWSDQRKRSPDLTHYCVAERIAALTDASPDRQPHHWLKVENAFLGRTAATDQRCDFWHFVAYYNFLQEIVGSGPRCGKYQPGIWSDAHEPFLAVMEALQPTFVVVLGKNIWKHLPPPFQKDVPIKSEGKTLERCHYRLASKGNVVAGGVAHPAAGLGATWHSVLMQAVEGLSETKV